MEHTSQSVDASRVNEAFQRIGRNLMLFQQIELLLKAVLSSTGVAGYASEIPAKLARRASEIGTKTLGQLANQYLDEILGRKPLDLSGPENAREVWYRYEFSIEADAATIERDKAVIDAIVEERNHLAHTFLTQWKPDSAESTAGTLNYLHAQQERALPVRDRLKAMLEDLRDGLKAQQEYIKSDHGARDFEVAWLQQSRLVQVLAHIASTMARPDGWTLLARAGQLAHDLAGDDFKSMAERYARAPLKRLLVASELFDVEEEPATAGHTRTIYRLKQADFP